MGSYNIGNWSEDREEVYVGSISVDSMDMECNRRHKDCYRVVNLNMNSALLVSTALQELEEILMLTLMLLEQ
jgi:hypothetical protein